MTITLQNRTEQHVEIYFHMTNNETIRKVLPQKAKTVAEALEDYRQTLLPDATSYGKTIYADGKYVGDIWCYCIDPQDTPNAMVSYCIFALEYWHKGIATESLKLFLAEIKDKFQLQSVGAFTFSENIPSIRVLESNNFKLMEEFEEDGVLSKYYELILI